MLIVHHKLNNVHLAFKNTHLYITNDLSLNNPIFWIYRLTIYIGSYDAMVVTWIPRVYILRFNSCVKPNFIKDFYTW